MVRTHRPRSARMRAAHAPWLLLERSESAHTCGQREAAPLPSQDGCCAKSARVRGAEPGRYARERHGCARALLFFSVSALAGDGDGGAGNSSATARAHMQTHASAPVVPEAPSGAASGCPSGGGRDRRYSEPGPWMAPSASHPSGPSCSSTSASPSPLTEIRVRFACRAGGAERRGKTCVSCRQRGASPL